jgi:protein-L-isoaspartate(D-aspartate) O-methyltransferase
MAFFGKREGSEPEETRRLRMVSSQIEARGVKDRTVLEAMRKVPRHLFVPAELQRQAYHDGPLSIGDQQTISQPYIVALMTEELRPAPGMKVLEIGTGSGYQAAVLAECGCHVFSIEILGGLGLQAAEKLRELGYTNVLTTIGDGYDGWKEHAPFDGILVTAAPPSVPGPLLEQLDVGGRLIIPLGRAGQDLVTITRTAKGHEQRSVIPVRFVPMTGKADRH